MLGLLSSSPSSSSATTRMRAAGGGTRGWGWWCWCWPSDRTAVWLLLLLGLVTLLYVYDFDRSYNNNNHYYYNHTSNYYQFRHHSKGRPLENNDENEGRTSRLRFTLNWTEWTAQQQQQEDEDSTNNSRSTPWRVVPDQSSPPLCNRSQIIRGMWVPEHLSKPPYIPTVVHLRCYPRDAYYDKKHGWDTHQWMPHDAAAGQCDFTQWRSDMYCAILRYSTVLIVGDSLSWEHYASLVQQLGIKTHQGYQHQSRELDTTIGQSVCDGKSQILYRRDDRLTKFRNALLPPGVGSPYGPPLPQVVILNRGAHYANDTLFLNNLKSNLDVVEEWQDKCDDLGIKCHFFWRTTVPGHPNCGNYTKPVKDKSYMEAIIGNLNNYDDHRLLYHWYDFQHQNLLAERELQSRKIRHRILDAYHLNVLRPDEHRSHQNDCLHSCYPGKMDVYSRLLLHYLRGDRTKNDVDLLRTVVRDKHWIINATTTYDRNATDAAKAARLAAGVRAT